MYSADYVNFVCILRASFISNLVCCLLLADLSSHMRKFAGKLILPKAALNYQYLMVEFRCICQRRTDFDALLCHRAVLCRFGVGLLSIKMTSHVTNKSGLFKRRYTIILNCCIQIRRIGLRHNKFICFL